VYTDPVRVAHDPHEHRRARPEEHAGGDRGEFQAQPGPAQIDPGHHERDDHGGDHERPEDPHDGQPAPPESTASTAAWMSRFPIQSLMDMINIMRPSDRQINPDLLTIVQRGSTIGR